MLDRLSYSPMTTPPARRKKNTMQEQSSLMTVKELSAYLKLHPLTVRKLAQDGQLPAFKIGRQWHVKRDVLDAWIERQSLQHFGGSA